MQTSTPTYLSLYDCERCNVPSPLVTTDVADADGFRPQVCLPCAVFVDAERVAVEEAEATALAEDAWYERQARR